MNQINLSTPIAFFMATITTLIYGSMYTYGTSSFAMGTYLDYALGLGARTNFYAETATTILLSFTVVFVSSFAVFWVILSLIVYTSRHISRARQG